MGASKERRRSSKWKIREWKGGRGKKKGGKDEEERGGNFWKTVLE